MKHFRSSGYFFWLLSVTALGLRLFLNIPPANLHNRGLVVWADILLVLILYAYINLTSLSIGRRISGRFQRYFSLTDAENWILSLLLGLPILGTSIFFLGLAGLLNESWIFILLALSGLLTCADWPGILKASIDQIRTFPRPGASFEFILWLIALGLLASTGLIALMPVWDYDALMYHLTVPAKFLEAGRIYFEPSMYRSAHPFLGEMLFIPGILLHLEPLAKLISLTYACLFMGSIFCFGKRFFTSEIATLAVGILLGNLAAPIWAASASIDFAWVTYEFWSFYAIMVWLNNHKRPSYHWLLLAGIMSGIAGSTKYLAVPPIAILVLLLAWKSYGIEKNFKGVLLPVLIFGGTTAFIMSPWYIKNWLWTGNPIYPLIFGGTNWDAINAAALSEYATSFGVGHNWKAWPLLPYYFYAHPGWFGDSRLAIVHPALWFAVGFPFLTQWKKHNILFVYGLLYICVWLIGIQTFRFLLPLSTLFSVSAASVIANFPRFYKISIRLILVIGMAGFALSNQLVQFTQTDILGYFTGQQSASDLLKNKTGNYIMTSFIEDKLKPTDKVLFLWDARAYYCNNRCVGDHEQAIAKRLSLNNPSPILVAKQLQANGFTYIMLNRWDAQWFVSLHDPFGLHKESLKYFDEIFIPRCGESIYSYSNGGQELYMLTCP